MSLAKQLNDHLPYLRRFARALSGSQASGDAYVAAVIESLLAAPNGFQLAGAPRTALFRTFLQIWNSIDLNNVDETVGGVEPDAARRRLEAMSSRARQAFLLTSVEGFSVEDVADIMSTDVAGVSALIDKAGREIAEQVSTDILIIEDEPLIAFDLSLLVEGLGHRVIGPARTRREAVKIFDANRTGLMLVDIQLADGSSGLEAVDDILQTASIPVIFITAYPERLLTGTRPEPVFLISKPFNQDTVKATISQALFFELCARPADRRMAALRA